MGLNVFHVMQGLLQTQITTTKSVHLASLVPWLCLGAQLAHRARLVLRPMRTEVFAFSANLAHMQGRDWITERS